MSHQHRKRMYRAQQAGVSRKELMNMQASFQADVQNYKQRLAMGDARKRNRDRYIAMYEKWKQQRAQANRPRNVR